jgi:hypothetical protein
MMMKLLSVGIGRDMEACIYGWFENNILVFTSLRVVISSQI